MFNSTRMPARLLVGAVIGLLIFSAVHYVRNRRTESRESVCRGRLSQIALALRNYHTDYGSFPPLMIRDETGRPIHSWRVLLLPYMDQQELYARYDIGEPWNGPADRAVNGILQLSPDIASVNFLTADLEVGTMSANSVIFRGSEADLLKRLLTKSRHGKSTN